MFSAILTKSTFYKVTIFALHSAGNTGYFGYAQIVPYRKALYCATLQSTTYMAVGFFPSPSISTDH